MEKQVVQGGDGIEENTLHWGRQELDQSVDSSRLEDGQQTLTVVAQIVQGANGSFGRLLVLKWNRRFKSLLNWNYFLQITSDIF